MNAAEAISNMRVLSRTQPSAKFLGATNSDLAFTGKYAIQGSYNGFQVWDISNPSTPVLTTAYYCPASQSDVSVYHNLLFVSGEAGSGRLDCGDQGVRDTVSGERLRGIRIFDITDIKNPKYIANVQTCRGSHTHTVLEDPKDRDNVYIYVSGSAGVRSPNEMAGCVDASPQQDSQSARFRIEVIKVPLARPEQAAIVTSPRIFDNLAAPARHGESEFDKQQAVKSAEAARARGEFTAMVGGQLTVIPARRTKPLLDSIARVRGGTTVTAADSATLRAAMPSVVAQIFGGPTTNSGPRPGPDQCHDITVYPGVGLAGGACGGYGLLLDISDPINPRRIDAAADSNFSYWHSATFSNDGSKVLFSDEWGGGGAAKCRSTDKKEWGADAIFTIKNGKMDFQSYYKLPAPQTANENCVAHNGSLIPIPDREVMVQSWYQGGISVFDWTNPKNPMEIAYFDRGPIDSTRMVSGGTWSAYWYNGSIVSSEIARGLDIAELTPSPYISQNEIDAAKTVHYEQLNAQGQPKMVWPPSFALAKSYVDQLERSKCLSSSRISSVRQSLESAEKAPAANRRDSLMGLATALDNEASASCESAKVRKLAGTARDLATVTP